jgi:hypothetical protein
MKQPTKMLKPAAAGTFPLIFLLLVLPLLSTAQEKPLKKKHEWYLSWGYNTEWYTHSKLFVSQPSLGNGYYFDHVVAHDHEGWNDGIFNKAISIPQYNYRLGYVFDEDNGLGLEINFDHTKYIFADQDVRLIGSLNKLRVDTTIAFNQANGFYYYLNNGANFLLINLVRRWHLMGRPTGKIRLDLLGKAGLGPVIPHVQNSLFGKANEPHFQLGGWNTGVEGALRMTLFTYAYLEYANKLDYARYSGLQIYEGTARQAFATYEMILSLGLRIP